MCSKLINAAVPKTIDERAINLNLSKQDIFRQRENLELGERSFSPFQPPMNISFCLQQSILLVVLDVKW